MTPMTQMNENHGNYRSVCKIFLWVLIFFKFTGEKEIKKKMFKTVGLPRRRTSLATRDPWHPDAYAVDRHHVSFLTHGAFNISYINLRDLLNDDDEYISHQNINLPLLHHGSLHFDVVYPCGLV